MSTPLPIYVLDANVFIDAHRRYYAFDICPGFWDAVLHYHKAGRIISIDKVRKEILAGDALEAWAKNNAPASLFSSTAEAAVTNHFAAMMQWVQAQAQFKPAAKAEFAGAADGWAAAYAKAYPDYVVVTHEEYARDAKKKVPLPNVCKQFGVLYVDTFMMLRDLNSQFQFSNP